MDFRYRNRAEAGRYLAEHLKTYAGRDDVLVLALPRGGVPVGFEVASALHAPLDVLLVRKLGVPDQEELAMGAVGSGGFRVLNEEVIHALGVTMEDIEEVTRRELEELDRRERAYRRGRPAPAIEGRIVILVDDGLATGSSMRVGVRAVRAQRPARTIVAVPVGAPDTCRDLQREADEVVCPLTPPDLYAVGLWYLDFSQTTDAEVEQLLARARKADGVPAA